MKTSALTCMIGWLTFWMFGAVAIFVDTLTSTQTIIAALMAFAGMLSGMTSYLKLCRECK